MAMKQPLHAFKSRIRPASSHKATRGAMQDAAHENPDCEIFRDRHHFEPPDHLLAEIAKGNVVIFAGAGISTEARGLFPLTFYDEIRQELRLGQKNTPAFPRLMSLYCEQPDGRRKLLEAIRNRFYYASSFPELLHRATSFHREISTLFYVGTYVTTNWDDYFEKYCGATPFVTPEDFALWGVNGRKVFKIHGSVSNYGSIIATEEDYRRARTQLERGALGSALKVLLATKTLLYVGYSFSDHDFASIQRYIARELRRVAPAAYIVSLDKASDQKFRQLRLTPIFTDATYFVQVIKRHLEKDGHLLPDSRLAGISQILTRVHREHHRLCEQLQPQRTPQVVITAAYQDGLLHAFDRMLAMAHTGQYSHTCEIVSQATKYERIIKDNLRRHQYIDAAYAQGYFNGITYLLLDDRRRKTLPLYFGFGLPEMHTLAEYKRALAGRRGHPNAAASYAKRIVTDNLGPKNLLHHTPFL
jgi:hypothetical protein